MFKTSNFTPESLEVMKNKDLIKEFVTLNYAGTPLFQGTGLPFWPSYA